LPFGVLANMLEITKGVNSKKKAAAEVGQPKNEVTRSKMPAS
jgi:hypothetical protein